jgi:hypothetical protein
MALRFDLGPDFADAAVLPDEERAAFDPHLSVLLFQDAVGFGHFPVLVGKQVEGQVLFLLETLLRFRGVGRNPQYLGVPVFKLRDIPAKLAGLGGSAGRVGLREKVQHYVLAAKIGETHGFPVLGRDFEIRRAIAFL